MKKYSLTTAMFILAVSVFFAPTFSVGRTAKQVSYPEGYRQWTHVKSMVIQTGHPLFDSFGGTHHIQCIGSLSYNNTCISWSYTWDQN